MGLEPWYSWGQLHAKMNRLFVLVVLLKVIVAARAEEEGAALDAIMRINEKAKSTFSVAVENTMPDLFEGDIVRTRSLDVDLDNMKYAAKNKPEELCHILPWWRLLLYDWSTRWPPENFHGK